MPFQGGLEASGNATLLFSAALALFYALMLARSPGWRRTVAKTAAIGLLAVLAAWQGGPALLVAALILSALGDAFLAHEGERPFLAGLASFLLAHLAYVALFWTAGGGWAALAGETWRVAAALPIAGFAVGMLLRLRPALPRQMRGPVTVYVAAILAMGLSALTLSQPSAICGAVAFMASDAILATERFLLAPASPHRAWSGQAVWWLYYIAQLSITLAFVVP